MERRQVSLAATGPHDAAERPGEREGPSLIYWTPEATLFWRVFKCTATPLLALTFSGEVQVPGSREPRPRPVSPGVIERVPFACHRAPAVGCVMAAHGGSGVIGHSIQVVNSVV